MVKKVHPVKKGKYHILLKFKTSLCSLFCFRINLQEPFFNLPNPFPIPQSTRRSQKSHGQRDTGNSLKREPLEKHLPNIAIRLLLNRLWKLVKSIFYPYQMQVPVLT